MTLHYLCMYVFIHTHMDTYKYKASSHAPVPEVRRWNEGCEKEHDRCESHKGCPPVLYRQQSFPPSGSVCVCKGTVYSAESIVCFNRSHWDLLKTIRAHSAVPILCPLTWPVPSTTASIAATSSLRHNIDICMSHFKDECFGTGQSLSNVKAFPIGYIKVCVCVCVRSRGSACLWDLRTQMTLCFPGQMTISRHPH